jgi:vacuolar-type H+-ATPase subunit I/STV1
MSSRSRMTKVDIQLLLFFYEVGMSKSSIARFFDKDHSTIIHHVQKYGAVQIRPLPRGVIEHREEAPLKLIRFERPQIPQRRVRVKTYAQYLKEDALRKQKERQEFLQQVIQGTAVGCRIVDHSTNKASDDLA